MKKIVRLTESDLHRIVKESVNRVLSEGKPADRQIGRHKFKGLKYNKNGNPIYTHPSKLDDPEGGTLSDDDLKAHGWKFSPKHGLHGQIQDPTRLPESVIREIEELPGLNDPHGLTGLEGDDEMSWSIHNIENAISNMDGSLLEQLVDRYNGLGKIMAKWLAENVGENRLRKDIPGFDYFI